MKILITTDLFLPSVNGVVTSVLSLVHGLEARGHEVRILTLSDTSRARTEGNVTYLPSVGLGQLYPGVRISGIYPPGIVRGLIDWHPDVVHSQCEFSTFAAARTVARRCGVPLVHTYHTVYEDYTHYFSPSVSMGRAMAANFTRHVVNRTDAVIAPTEKVSRLLKSYGVSVPVAVIPTGLELENAPQTGENTSYRASARTLGNTSDEVSEQASDQASDDLRRRLGIPAGRRVLVSLGRLAEEKNIPELFRLLDTPSLRDAVLLLVGDGPYRAELERLARQLRLDGRVIFAGMVSHAQVWDYYRLGDVFVNASGSETQGLTYIEAMAAGLAVVCRADPCVEGLIENGVTGFACPDTAGMVAAVERLCADSALRRRVTDAAAARVSSTYTSAAFSAAVEELYLNVVGQKERRAAEITERRNILS